MTTTISLDWKEVYDTNCPLISASNVDQELGWTAEEFGKIGVQFAYFRSRPETDWYPHYIHNQENLIRFGGLFPPIHVHADYRRTRMLGLTHVPYEGGCMMVRANDKFFRMSDLKGKKIGITKSLNTLKNDWWRIQEHQGILAMLRMNGMTEKDVKHVDMVPNLSAQNMAMVNIGKDFMLKQEYIKNDFDVEKWAAPEFLAQAAKELLENKVEMTKLEKIPTMKGRVG